MCACRISVAEQENTLKKRKKIVAAGTNPALKGLKSITRQTVATAKNNAHRPFETQYLPNRLQIEHKRIAQIIPYICGNPHI